VKVFKLPYIYLVLFCGLIPFVHAIDEREDFRRKSFFSDISRKVISGYGTEGYVMALEDAIKNK